MERVQRAISKATQTWSMAMKLACAILIAVMLHPSTNTLQAQDLPRFPSFQTREEKRVLAPGGAPGTFRFRYEETIQWMGEPAFPVVVSVKQDRENVLVKIFDANPIELELDLKPGAYEIQSEPATIEAKKQYWRALGTRIEVDSKGTAQIAHRALVHRRMMELIGPGRQEFVRESRPILRWKPIENAVYYTVGWFEKTREGEVIRTEQNLRTRTPCYGFETDLVPDRTYEWFVDAFDDAGRLFAYYSSGYFRSTQTGTFLGVQLPDPDKPADQARGRVGDKGALIVAVVADSPAGKAGLQGGDTILSLDDTPIVSFGDLRQELRTRTAGTNSTLKILRDGEEILVQVRLGEIPGEVWKDPIGDECDDLDAVSSARDSNGNVEKLRRIGSSQIPFGVGSHAVWSDLDRDGHDEMVVPAGSGALLVIDSEGKVRSVSLAGARDDSTITEVIPVRIGARAHFFVAFAKYDHAARESAWVGVYRDDGEMVWEFSPKKPDGHDVELKIAAGDLRGDGAPEFVIGLMTYSKVKTGPSSHELRNAEARVVILNADRSLLVDKAVGRWMTMVAVVSAEMNPDRPQLLCFVGQKLLRYEFRRVKDEESDLNESP